MRFCIAGTLVATLFATNLLLAETTTPSNAPLAPGMPQCAAPCVQWHQLSM
jgi:hypothetical protein